LRRFGCGARHFEFWVRFWCGVGKDLVVEVEAGANEWDDEVYQVVFKVLGTRLDTVALLVAFAVALLEGLPLADSSGVASFGIRLRLRLQGGSALGCYVGAINEEYEMSREHYRDVTTSV
jgi:hypothetical protein